MSKKKWLWILLAVNICLVLAVLGSIYGYGVSRYKSRFLKGTFINGIDCSDLEPGEVCRILDSQIQGYALEVMGRDPSHPENVAVLGTITPGDVSLHRKDTTALVREIFEKQDAYRWYEMLWNEERDYHFEQEITFEPQQLTSVLTSWEACGGSTVVDPQDAYVSAYLPEENAYRVVPDTRGSRLDSQKAVPAIEQALYDLKNSVDIEDTGCYAIAKVRADDTKLNALVNQVNSWLGATIRYNWYGTELTVGREEMARWVSLVDGEPVLDEDAVREFVKEAKKEYDPKGHTYVFHTSLGADLNLKCKSGWVTDADQEGEELIRLIKEGAVTDRQPISSTENYVFFDGTVGASYAEVDLTNQHMYFYHEGELVLESDFVSGDVASGHATPEGIFAVTFKARDRILRGPDYASFVHYWMPFYGGYGMHDAMWRRVFGGSIFMENGSHGCVNLPLKNAEKIYDYVETGFPVVCYYYPVGKNPAELVAVSGAAEAAGNAQGAGSNEGNAQGAGAGSNEGNEQGAGAGGADGAAQGADENTGSTGENGSESSDPGISGQEQIEISKQGGSVTEENEIKGQW